MTTATRPSVACPFSLSLDPMAAMLNFEIADDPTYAGVEIQRFDDGIHGKGITVLLMRRDDRRVDVYRQPTLMLDPDAYVVGAGLGEWMETAIEPARLEVTSAGVIADVGFWDAAGRRVQIRIDDRGGRPRRPAALLAPVSAAIEEPTSMLLVWMSRFDLVRARGEEPRIQIAGRPATTGRLPAPWLHRRRLIKYASDLAVVRLNPSQAGSPHPVPAHDGMVEVAPGKDGASIVAISATAENHDTRLSLDPPLLDPSGLPDGASVAGTWRLSIDEESSVVSGTWTAKRVKSHVDITFDSTAKWRPGPLPFLMRVVTRVVPTFRTWPQTYRWRARLTLDPTPTLAAGWERTSEARDESYGRMMRVGAD